METKKQLILTIVVLTIAFLITPVFGGGPSGQAGKSNVGHLYLYEKNPTDWSIVPGGAWGKMKYNLAGPTFDFVFNGHGLSPNTSYTLIYYADPWPGNNPGAYLASAISNGGGNINLSGSVNLGIDLPSPPDLNSDTNGNCGGGAFPCPGAKIWLVLSIDYKAGTNAMIGWNPTEYLFEYQSIRYDDTDAP